MFSHSDIVTLLFSGKLERPGVNVSQSAEDREKGIDEDEKRRQNVATGSNVSELSLLAN